MKIFSAVQIRQYDQQTIREQSITSVELMERASNACLKWILQQYDHSKRFVIICGMGNNGGDGLALTRLLIENGYAASALVLKHSKQFSTDASLNFKRLHEIAPNCISILNESEEISGISDDLILVDALFGTGINRPITGWVSDFVQIMNSLPNEKLAIDMPSGLPADTLPSEKNIVFKVNRTLTFQLMKRSLLHPEGHFYSGNVSILDISLSTAFHEQTPSQYEIIDTKFLKAVFSPRKPFSHKGDYGNALLIGGSYGMTGAITLSSFAALRSGVGKVTTLAPECSYIALQTLCPEALFQRGGENFIEKINPEKYAAIGIGPGLGQNILTKRAFITFLKQTKQPLILDADALNIIAEDSKNLLSQIPAGSILTPHVGEFKRLFGESLNSMERIETARNEAMRLNMVIILKGHHTAVLTPDGACFYNSTGNAGLAKGGSGDVLTGILTGLMAQGYSAENSALLGIWLHGKSADLAVANSSMESITAKDICDYLGKSFRLLTS